MRARNDMHERKHSTMAKFVACTNTTIKQIKREGGGWQWQRWATDNDKRQRWGGEGGGAHDDRGMKEEACCWAKQHNNQTVRRGGVNGDGEELRRAVLRVEGA